MINEFGHKMNLKEIKNFTTAKCQQIVDLSALAQLHEYAFQCTK